MIDTLFYIANSPVNPPQNWQDLLIELNYGKDQFPQGNAVSITNFEWVRENNDWIRQYIDAGLTGGVGIFEAPLFRIDVTDGTTTKTVFNGYIDLTDNLQLKERIKLTAKATSRATVDWINDVANGFTFEYLASLNVGDAGKISPFDYRFMPYVNNSVPNYEQAAIATLMVYTITQTIAKEIEEISGFSVEAGVPFTTIQAVIKLVIKIAYLLVLIVTLIKLIKDLMRFIISPVKYHAGMYVRDLMGKACEYLGMTFQSDIWAVGSPYYNEFIIPEKLFNAPSKTDSAILGFLLPDVNEQIGFYKGTFGSLLDAMKLKYNAKIVVTVNNEVIFLRKDKNAQPAVYQLPDIYLPEFTYNTDELKANTLIEFRTDNLDTNTLNDYSGSVFQVICQPLVVTDRALVMYKGFDNVTIPFARASTKTDLTVPEKIIRDFLVVFETLANVLVSVVNGIGSVVNGIISIIKKIFKFLGIRLNIPAVPTMNKLNLSIIIENRIGMMVLSFDHFNVPKILIIKEGSKPKFNKIDPINPVFETAKAMWDNFYYVNSFVPAQLNSAYADRPTGNQFIKKTFPKVSFTWQDFLDVFTNNRIYDSVGNEALIESLKFNPYKNMAEITVRFNKIYTLNISEKYLNPDGR